MSGFPHQGFAAGFLDRRCQALGALHVKNDGAARVAFEHIGGQQHQLAVGVNDLAVFGDHTQAVAIAVKGQAEFSIGAFYFGNQLSEIFRFAGIGVVVGEVAIDLGVHLRHVAAQGAQHARGRCAGNAIAAIDDDFHGSLELAITRDACLVLGTDVHRGTAALGLHITFSFHALAQLLNIVTINGAAC